MKIFITGGAGFIGSHLVDLLLLRNYKVLVYDNLSSGKLNYIAHNIGNKNFVFIKNDLLNFSELKRVMKGYDFVFHLAANPDIKFSSRMKTDLDLKQGTFATYNVLEAMRANGIYKIAFASSSTVYGEPRIVPTPEDYAPLHPISLYGASKLACEGLLTAYSHLFGFKVWIFRFANVVGSRMTHGILFDFLRKIKKNPHRLEILGNGKQKKSYLLVDECVNAMLYAINKTNEQINVFNLGCADQISVKEIAKIFVEEMGLRKVQFVFKGGDRGWKGDVPIMLLSVDKINTLGWKARHTSQQAIRIALRNLIKCR